MARVTSAPQGHPAERPLRIGEVAVRVGVSADSIRHYERLGLLPAPQRTDGGYRVFSPAAIERVRLIRSAVRVGFTLRQLGAFLRERQTGGIPCRKVRDAASDILRAVDAQIVDLRATSDALTALLRHWDERLAGTPPGEPARLLESMPPLMPATPGPRAVRRRRSAGA